MKSSRKHFYANVPLILNKLSCVSGLLVGSETLGTLFNTLTTDHMYSCHNSQKFELLVQTQLSSKPSTFSSSSIAFSKSTESFEHFEKKSPS